MFLPDALAVVEVADALVVVEVADALVVVVVGALVVASDSVQAGALAVDGVQGLTLVDSQVAVVEGSV